MGGRPDDLHASSPRELAERLRALGRGDTILFFMDQAGRQQVVHLDEANRARLTVGRHPDNDIALTWDDEVSRFHAQLERTRGEWTVVDDNRSRNGTFINEQRVIGRHRLNDGDIVRTGRTLLVYRGPQDPYATPSTRGASRLPIPALTAAQHNVARELCRPLFRPVPASMPATNDEIATALFVQRDTVKSHLKAMFSLLSVDDAVPNRKRAELANRLLELGIVTRSDYDL